MNTTATSAGKPSQSFSSYTLRILSSLLSSAENFPFFLLFVLCHFSFVATGQNLNLKSTRLSADFQVFRMPPTQYHITQVDSFSIGSSDMLGSTQFTIKVEFPFRKHQQTLLITGLGIGTNTFSHQFFAQAEFTKSRAADIIQRTNTNTSGVHLVPLIGVARKHRLGKFLLQHTLSANVLIPIFLLSGISTIEEELYNTLLSMNDPMFFQKSLLEETTFEYKYQNSKVLFGLEYQPELVFDSRREGPVLFYALGLVFNYSWGNLLRGKVIVDNDRTRYEGWATQGFSKIGVSFRVGWDFEKSRAKKNKS